VKSSEKNAHQKLSQIKFNFTFPLTQFVCRVKVDLTVFAFSVACNKVINEFIA